MKLMLTEIRGNWFLDDSIGNAYGYLHEVGDYQGPQYPGNHNPTWELVSHKSDPIEIYGYVTEESTVRQILAYCKKFSIAAYAEGLVIETMEGKIFEYCLPLSSKHILPRISYK